jgi:hypothetical protein
MSYYETFTPEEAQQIGDRLAIDWDQINLEEFTKGLSIEMEHGAHDPDTDITNDDPLLTAKIAWAHLKEIPDYYTRLEELLEDADL